MADKTRDAGARVVVIGGAGAMGQVIVRDLVESGVAQVVIADFDLGRARSAVTHLAPVIANKNGSVDLAAAFTDITSHQAMVETLTGANCVINSTPYYRNVDVMQAALAAQCNYIDLGGLFHVTREQLKLHDQFAAAGLTAILGMGAAPGMTNIMAADAQVDLDTVDSIEIFVGSIDNVKYDHPFLVPYSIETLIDEYTKEPMVFEDGAFKSVPALSGACMVNFPQPVGRQEAIYTLHSEVLTLPMTFAPKGIKKATFRLGLPLDFHQKMKFLMALGLGSHEPIVTRDKKGSYTPREALAAILAKFDLPAQEPDDCEVVRVDVIGTRDGEGQLVRLETVVNANKDWQVSCGALDTGVPPSIVAQMFLRGEIVAQGVLPPEVAVPAAPFFVELARRQIVMTRSVHQV